VDLFLDCCGGDAPRGAPRERSVREPDDSSPSPAATDPAGAAAHRRRARARRGRRLGAPLAHLVRDLRGLLRLALLDLLSTCCSAWTVWNRPAPRAPRRRCTRRTA
jgi:hypothetical protein